VHTDVGMHTPIHIHACTQHIHICAVCTSLQQYLPVLQLLRNRLVATARNCMRKNASLGQVYESMQEAYQQMQTPSVYQEPSARV
jgi:hypothetical protein